MPADVLSLIRKALGRAAAARSPDPGIQAMHAAEASVRRLIDARADAAIGDRLAKSLLPRDDRGKMHRIAKAAPPQQRAVIFKALDALDEVTKAADAVLFKELGHSMTPPLVADTWAAVRAQAAAVVAKSGEPPLSEAQRIARVLKSDPSIYRELRRERRMARGEPV